MRGPPRWRLLQQPRIRPGQPPAAFRGAKPANYGRLAGASEGAAGVSVAAIALFPPFADASPFSPAACRNFSAHQGEAGSGGDSRRRPWRAHTRVRAGRESAPTRCQMRARFARAADPAHGTRVGEARYNLRAAMSPNAYKKRPQPGFSPLKWRV